MRKIKSFNIGEFTFEVNNLPCKKALAVMIRIKDTIIAPISDALKIDTEKNDASSLISSVLGALTEENLDFLCETYQSVTTYQYQDPGKRGKNKFAELNDYGMDIVFGGNIDHMFLWLYECLGHDFGNFISKAVGVLPENVLSNLQGAFKSKNE
jgi:hypothetical protein